MREGGLGPDARALLDSAEGGDEPSVDDAARVRAKLAGRLALAASGVVVATSTKTAAAGTGALTTTGAATGGAAMATTSLGLGAKALIAAALVGGVTASTVALAPERHLTGAPSTPASVGEPPPPMEPSPPARASASPVATPAKTAGPTAERGATASAPSEATPPAAPSPLGDMRVGPAAPHEAATRPVGAPRPVGAASARGAEGPPRAADEGRSTTSASAPGPAAPARPIDAARQADALTEEATLLRSAQAALARGDADAALARLDDHERRFPRGALTEERQAARVLALCASGRATEARALATTFAAASPRSPLAAQVRRACATRDTR